MDSAKVLSRWTSKEIINQEGQIATETAMTIITTKIIITTQNRD